MQHYDLFEAIISISTDDKKEIEKIESEALKHKFCKTVRANIKNNRSSARNAGILSASSDILFFIDEDMLLNPMFMSRLFTATSDVHLHNFVINASRSELEPSWARRLLMGEISDNDIKSFLSEYNESYYYEWDRSIKWADDNEWNFFYSNNICVSKSFVDNNDLYFDEKFNGWGEEDVDWIYRAKLNNAKIGRYENKCWHINHPFVASERKESYRKNVEYMVEKHPGILSYRGEWYQECGIDFGLRHKKVKE